MYVNKINLFKELFRTEEATKMRYFWYKFKIEYLSTRLKCLQLSVKTFKEDNLNRIS